MPGLSRQPALIGALALVGLWAWAHHSPQGWLYAGFMAGITLIILWPPLWLRERLALAILLTSASMALYQLTFPIPWWLALQWAPPGFMFNANVLAVVLLAGVAWAASGQRWALAGILALPVLISNAMSAYLAAAVGLAFWLWRSGRRRLVLWSGLAGAVALALVGVALAISGRALPQIVAMRLIIWREAWRLFLAYPIWGVGPGGFAVAGDVQPVLHAHNLYLQAAAVGGLVGCGALGLILWQLFRETRGNFTAAAILVSLLAHGMADFIYWVPGAALALALVWDAIERRAAPPALSPVVILIAGLGLVILHLAGEIPVDNYSTFVLYGLGLTGCYLVALSIGGSNGEVFCIDHRHRQGRDLAGDIRAGHPAD